MEGGERGSTILGKGVLVQYRQCEKDSISYWVAEDFQAENVPSLEFVGRRAATTARVQDHEAMPRGPNIHVLPLPPTVGMKCAKCGKSEGVKKCMRCQSVYYCSTANVIENGTPSGGP